MDGFLAYFNEVGFRGDLPKLPNLDSSKEQATLGEKLEYRPLDVRVLLQSANQERREV